MIFLSRGKSPSLLMVPGFEEIVQTVHGNIPQIKKPVWLKFQAAAQPFEAPGLPTQWGSGKAFGYLDSEVAARKVGMSKEDVEQFLLSHPSHGVEYIGISEGGEEITDEERFFIPEGEGGYFCKLCEQHLRNGQAKAGHTGSKAHQEKVELAVRLLREKIVAA